jgi:hypothetical protein
MDEVTACKSVLIEVLTVLGRDLDKLVVVGGWVPELTFPDRGHIGSLDVDLALDARKILPLAYESIRRKLTESGYRQSSEAANRFYRPVRGTSLQVKVDLITGEFPEIAAEGTHIQVQDLPVWKARGVDLAFSYPQEVVVEGVLPDGGHNRVTVRLPSIAAFVCIKAITLGERMKEKDAYDIYFCIDHYPGGYKALAAEVRGKLDDRLIVEGVNVLRDKFARLDSIGPVWAARTAEGATVGTDDVLETEQRRAYELVNALLRTIDEPTGE